MLIRRIAEQDYPPATDIHNAQNEPHWHFTSEQMRRSDEAAQRSTPRYKRYVAEKDGEVIATGYLTPVWAGKTVAGRVWAGIFTRADHRSQGIDTRLLEHALTAHDYSVQEVWSCVREDFVPISGYLHDFRGGFQEQFRSFGSELHLLKFDAAKFAPLIERLEAEGVTLKRYADLSDNPKRDENLLALHAETEADAPHHEPIIPARYPDIRDAEIDRDSVFVAVKEGRYVGYISLEVNGRTKTGLAFLGVARPYRSQGIGTALGARVAEYAKSSRYTELGTGGAKENIVMQRVLIKLGFELEPDWVTFSKSP